jgi:P27 family predicted phage terminase small subunit
MAKRGPKPLHKKAPRLTSRGPWKGFRLPDDLSPEARAEVARLVDRLRAVRNYSRVDPQAVVSLARVNVLLDRAFRQIEAEGLQVEAQNGMRCAHPMVKVANTFSMRQKMLMQQLGLIDRGKGSREAPPEPVEQDDDGGWADLLRIADTPPGPGD